MIGLPPLSQGQGSIDQAGKIGANQPVIDSTEALTTEQRCIPQREVRRAIVDHYQLVMADSLIDRLVFMSSDPEFLALSKNLSLVLGISLEEAGSRIYPVTRQIYLAAKEARRSL